MHQSVIAHHRRCFGCITAVVTPALEPRLQDLLVRWERWCETGYTSYANVLPVLSCLAAGGTVAEAIPVGASWSLLYLASLMLDDVQDRDKNDQLWSTWTPPDLLASGLALLFAAYLPLTELKPAITAAIVRHWSGVGMLAAQGQRPHADPDLRTACQGVIANTGMLFAGACWAGGRARGQDEARLQALQTYGLALGMVVQLRDALRDLAVDLRTGNSSLPLTLALARVEHPLHGRLTALLAARATWTAAQAQEGLDLVQALGGVTAAMRMASLYRQQAVAALATPGLCAAQTQPLVAYVSALLPHLD